MAFQLKKIGDHGTANSIVARLSLQTQELLGFCTIPEKKKQDVAAHYFYQIQPHLLTCDTIARRISADIEKILAELNGCGLTTQAGGRVIEVPQVPNLDQDVEQYLYQAKSVLREAIGIFKILFDKGFDGPKFDELIKWSQERFGERHEFVRMLAEDQHLWLRQLIGMRNAIEHPGGSSGLLYIRNFEYDESQNVLTPPSWQLNDGARLALALELPAYVNNMLTFCEDLLVVSIHTVGIIPGVGFAQISETDRDSNCPMRLRALPLAHLAEKQPSSVE